MKNLNFLFLFLILGFISSCDNPEDDLHNDPTCDSYIAVQVEQIDDASADCEFFLSSTAVDFYMYPTNLLEFVDSISFGDTFEIVYQEKPDAVNICQLGRIVEIICLEQ